MPKKKDSTGTTAKKDSRKTSSSKVESPKTQPTARTTVAEPTKSTAPPPAAKPAEAAKPTPPAAPPPVAKPAEAAKPTPPAAPPPVAKSTPAAKAAAPAKTAPAKSAKSAATKANPPVTIIVAKYDIGHGNNLYIRGEGAGLSWESGIQMENVGRDVWVWTTNQIAEGMVAFKFLINDEIWSTGDNLSASAGETTTLTPYF